MLSIRVLNGLQAGQIYNLKPGLNKIGRSLNCDLQINSPGISKEHAEINVFADKVVIRDLNSSNGTFVNGIKIQNSLLQLSDKLSLHETLFEIIDMQIFRENSVNTKNSVVLKHKSAPSPQRRPASVRPSIQPQPMPSSMSTPPPVSAVHAISVTEKMNEYFNKVFLPGLYKLTEVFEFKMVIIGFAAVFVLLVTLLAIVPMKIITTESILTESKRRALTVARALSQANEKTIRTGDISSFSTDLVLREDGIDDVYIVAKDGSIIAPPERAGTQPKEIGFINSIKGQTKDVATEIKSGIIAASTPILNYDPDLQQNAARAHVVVVYNAGSLAVDDGRVLSLFIQMLTISLVVGSILFFLMYKLIEYPWLLLNQKMDAALRENKDHVEIQFSFASLQTVLININSLLGRAFSSHQKAPSADASALFNLVNIIHGPALILDKDLNILSVNNSFESLIGVFGLNQQNLKNLPDESLKSSLMSLVHESKINSQSTTNQTVAWNNYSLDVHAQPVHEGEYCFITLTLAEGTDKVGGAA